MTLRRGKPASGERRASSADADAADVELAARVARGDTAAFERVYERHGPACYGLARRVLRDDGLAQDVVQEVFVRYWQQPERFHPERGRLAGWLLTITHRRSIDVVRREQARPRHPVPVDEMVDVPDRTDVALEADLADRAERTREVIAGLPPAQREVVLLAYFGGLSQREIAQRLGIPIGTVKSRTLAAMLRLRDALGDLRVDLVEDTP